MQMNSLVKLRRFADIPGVDMEVFYTDIDQALVNLAVAYAAAVEELLARRLKEGTQ